MKIYFDKLYKDDRIKELCGICVPFKKGALTKDAIDTVTILDVDRKVPSQTRITSTWEDTSWRPWGNPVLSWRTERSSASANRR